MSRYFIITSGLRGCYMPDSHEVVRCDTRAELKAILEDEADARAEGAYGLSRRDVAWAANHAWRKGSKGAILPFGQRPRERPFAIEISPATRKEWLDNNEGNN
jgi:hypothetical protein